MAINNKWQISYLQEYIQKRWIKYYRKADSRHTEIRFNNVTSFYNITEEALYYLIAHDTKKHARYGISCSGSQYSFTDKSNPQRPREITSQSFYGKLEIIKLLGYPVDTVKANGVRQRRNEFTHESGTISSRYSQADADRDLSDLADIMISLGLMTPEQKNISPEDLRTKEQDHEVIDEKYEIMSLIAEGGMSYVYLAKYRNEIVALKELKIGTFDLEQIEREADILCKISNHEYNIPFIKDHFRSNRTYYIVMEYIDGQDLSSFPVKYEKNDKKTHILEEILRTTKYLHKDCGLILKDLKPQNIMIDKKGKVWIIDFGVSTTNARTDTSCVFSQGYSAPEVENAGQSKDLISEKSDIYSIGCLMLLLYFDQNGYSEKIMNVLAQKFEAEKGKNKLFMNANQYLWEIIKKCTDQKPQNRYKNIDALWKDLRVYKRKRIHLYTGIAAASLAVLIGGSIIYFSGSSKETLSIPAVGEPITDIPANKDSSIESSNSFSADAEKDTNSTNANISSDEISPFDESSNDMIVSDAETDSSSTISAEVTKQDIIIDRGIGFTFCKYGKTDINGNDQIIDPWYGGPKFEEILTGASLDETIISQILEKLNKESFVASPSKWSDIENGTTVTMDLDLSKNPALQQLCDEYQINLHMHYSAVYDK